MPVKKVQQSVPAGAVAPQPVRPPPPWVPPRPAPPPVPAEDLVEYPSEDGIPMASSVKHALWMIACFQTLAHWFRDRLNVFVGIDLLVFYERGKKKASVAPDVFVSFGVPMRDLPSYKVWEAGKPPDVVWEFGSRSTVKGDAGEKKEKYRRIGVREYWLVDLDAGYHDRPLKGFELVNGKYVELPWEERPDGTLAVWSPALQLEQRCTEGGLRFWDRETKRYLELPEEEKERLRQEAESRADREAQARKQEAQARKEAESRADREAQARKQEAQARKEAESRADREAQARREADQAHEVEIRKRKALEARIAELESGARSPRNPD